MTALRAMMYSAAISDSVGVVMSCLIIWAMLRMATLFCGICDLLDKN